VDNNLNRDNYDMLSEVSWHSWLGLLMSLLGGERKTAVRVRFLCYRETGAAGAENVSKTKAKRKKKKKKKRNRLVKEPKVRWAWLRRRYKLRRG